MDEPQVKSALKSENYTLCRICLRYDSEDISSLFQPITENDIFIHDKIMQCAKVQITATDSLPKIICTNCLKDLEVAFDFKLRCEKSDGILRKLKEEIVYENLEQLKEECELLHETKLNDDIIYDELDNGDEEATKKVYCCQICKKVYKHEKSYETHIANARCSNEIKKEMYNITGIGNERVFHCTVCEYTSKKEKHMEIHYRTHTGEKPHSCDACPIAYSQLSTLLRHKRTAHSQDTPFSCELCGKRFKIGAALKRHHITHTPDQPHVCNVCGKRFKWKHVLNDHQQRHTNVKTLSCETCGRLFISKIDLLNHLLIHKKDTLYSCQLCSFKTYVKNYLKRHSWTHTGEARCSCEICGKVFSKPGNLLAHKIVHSGVRAYSCTLCDKKYKHSSVLNKHMKNAHGTNKEGATAIFNNVPQNMGSTEDTRLLS